MLARCRVHEVSQEWGCEWGSSYMNESIHSVSSHDCRFLRSRMRCASLVITPNSMRHQPSACAMLRRSAACVRPRRRGERDANAEEATGEKQLLRLERPEASLTNRLLLRRSMRQRLSGVIPSP